MVSAGVSSLARASPGLAQSSSAWAINHARSAASRSANAGTLRNAAISASVRAWSGCSVMRDLPRQSSNATWPGTWSLHLGQILMHELHDDGALADAGGDTLHRAVAHVTDDKNARNIGFEQAGIAVERPAFRALAIVEQVRTGQDDPALIAHHQRVEPFGARLRADEDEQASGRELFGFRGDRTLDGNLRKPRVPGSFDHAGVGPDLDVGSFFDLLD